MASVPSRSMPYIDFRESTSYTTQVLMYVAVVGLLAVLFLRSPVTADGASGPADGPIWGYGLVVVALAGALVNALAISARSTAQDTRSIGALYTIWELVSSSSSIMVTLVLVVWAVAINSFFYKQINQGFVTSGYVTLARTLSALMAATVLINFYDLTQRGDSSQSNVHSAIVYLLDTFSTLVLTMMNISLLFFSTDG